MANLQSNDIFSNLEDSAQLRLFLESQAEAGAKLHPLITGVILAEYLKATDNDVKLLFGLEIFCKLMQTLEDFALACLTWADPKWNGDPLGSLLGTNTRDIFKFYQQCEEGLSDEKIWDIFGKSPPEEATKVLKLNNQDAEKYQRLMGIFAESTRLTLKSIALTYTSKPGKLPIKGKYGDIVNMYFNVKHGVKIIWRTEKTKPIFNQYIIPNNFVPILVSETIQAGKNGAKRGLYFGGFTFTHEFVMHMAENVRFISKTISSMARMRLDWLDDKNISAKMPWQEEQMIEDFRLQIERTPLLTADEKVAIRKKWSIPE
jgi:hypothetical protein